MRWFSLLGTVARGALFGAAVRFVGGVVADSMKWRAGRALGFPAGGRRWRAAAPMLPMTPMGAVARGIVAGAAGSFAQGLFFVATRRITPATPQNVFSPSEEAQREETATQTVARRVVVCMMGRGPIRDKERAGEIVHVAFGSAWGGVYGLLRGTWPGLGTPAGAAAFGTIVWGVSDNLLLPAFRLAAWPQAYPLRVHVYAWVAHLAYGFGVWGAFEAQRRSTWAPLVAAASARWAARRLPGPVRPVAARALRAARVRRLGERMRAAVGSAARDAVARAA
jgi:hypothetical protein